MVHLLLQYCSALARTRTYNIRLRTYKAMRILGALRPCLQFTKPHCVQVFLGVGSSGNRFLYSNEGPAAVYHLLPTALCLISETKPVVLMFCASKAQESKSGRENRP